MKTKLTLLLATLLVTNLTSCDPKDRVVGVTTYSVTVPITARQLETLQQQEEQKK
jgi:hypothetical protein